MYQLALVGNPIAHSLSPVIFAEFGRQTGISLDYQLICSPIDDFEHVVRDFFAKGGHALNVTAPFKSRAYALASRHQPQTQLSGTANVLVKSQSPVEEYKTDNKSTFSFSNELVADNTDGLGIVADFEYHKISLNNKNILIIGSGSVVFSILPSLEKAKPKRIDLLMRDWDKLDQFLVKSYLIDEFSADIDYDIVINTTPNNPDNQLFSQINQLSADACLYDMNYTAKETLFMQQVAANNPNLNLNKLNGLGMLIQQAKYGFHAMFGVYPPQIDELYPLLAERIHD